MGEKIKQTLTRKCSYLVNEIKILINKKKIELNHKKALIEPAGKGILEFPD
jgi:hypothetical protein